MNVLRFLSLPRVLTTLGFMIVLLAVPAEDLSAQYQYVHIDAVFGSDTTGLGTPQAPFQSITFANNWIGTNPPPTILYCNPGIYSQLEQFPIDMKPDVHLISTRGAKETIIRDNTNPLSFPMAVWWPLTNNPAWLGKKVLVSFMRNYSMGIASIQGFTLQGGDVQLFAGSDHGGRGLAANCHFDMRNTIIKLNGANPPTRKAPTFGALIIAGAFAGGTYVTNSFQLLNNTFTQNWDKELGPAENIAICDTIVNTLSGWPLQGVNPLSIQNNLIRSVPNNLQIAMIGIDDGDTMALNPTTGLFVDTNSFPTNQASTASLLNTFTSGINGATPQPKVKLLSVPPFASDEVDPCHVGEMLNWNIYPGGGPYAATNPSDPWVRDFRIINTSPLVDQGLAPTATGTGVRHLQAKNGNLYVDYYDPTILTLGAMLARTNGFMWEISAFVWDGEGYGNPREVGASIDIGFDEESSQMVAGCYGNDTRCHNVVDWFQGTLYQHYQYQSISNDGVPDRHYFFPADGAPGNTPLDTQLAIMYLSPWAIMSTGWPPIEGTNYHYSILNAGSTYPIHPWGMPNSYDTPQQVNPDLYPGRWFLFNMAVSPCTLWFTWNVSPSNWNNMLEGRTYEVVHQLWISADDVTPTPLNPFILNHQFFYQPNVGIVRESNLQSEYY